MRRQRPKPRHRPGGVHALKQLSRPIRLSTLSLGDVVYARVFWGAGWGEWKVRPVVFLEAQDRRTARVLPVYSKPRGMTSVAVVLSGRRCFMAYPAISLDVLDVVAKTDQNLVTAVDAGRGVAAGY